MPALLGGTVMVALAVGFALWLLMTSTRSEPVAASAADGGRSAIPAPPAIAVDHRATDTGPREPTRDDVELADAPWLRELWSFGEAALVTCQDDDTLAMMEALLQAAGHVAEHAPMDRARLHFERKDNNWGGEPTAFARRLALGPPGNPMGNLSSLDGQSAMGEVLRVQFVTLVWERPIAHSVAPAPDQLNRIETFMVSVWWDHDTPDEFSVDVTLDGGAPATGTSTEQHGGAAPGARITYGASYEGYDEIMTTWSVHPGSPRQIERGEFTPARAQINRLRAAALEFLQVYETRVDRVLAGVPVH